MQPSCAVLLERGTAPARFPGWRLEVRAISSSGGNNHSRVVPALDGRFPLLIGLHLAAERAVGFPKLLKIITVFRFSIGRGRIRARAFISPVRGITSYSYSLSFSGRTLSAFVRACPRLSDMPPTFFGVVQSLASSAPLPVVMPLLLSTSSCG